MSHAKRPEDRQRRNLPAVMEPRATTPESGKTLPAPAAPRELSAVLRTAWRGLWTSPVAQLLDPVSDLPAVTRLFGMYTLLASVDKQIDAMTRLVATDPDARYDTGLVTLRVKLSTEARQLEAQLGCSPRSRLALGLALLAGRKGGSLDDMADGDDG